MFFLTYANMDNVSSQVSGSSSVLAADWNTYVRDNFDDIKAGHVVLATADRLALGVPATGTVVFDSTLGILMLFNGSAWVVSPGSSLTSTQKIAIPAPATGSFIYDSTLGVFQFYNGSAWVSAQGSPPVLTTAQKTALGSVTTGTMVYDSTLGVVQLYNGTSWIVVVSPSAVGLTVNFPSNVIFNNQSSFGLFGLAGLRSTFVKRYTSTSVLVTLSVGAVELTSGLAQQYALGMYNPTSGSVEIGRQYSFGAGTSYSTFSGSNVMWSGLAAGTYTVEPAFREFSGSSSFTFRSGGYNSVSSAMSYSLLEVN